jgi:hypothetical protein
MKKIQKSLIRFLRFVASSIAGHILMTILLIVSAILLPILINEWEMLQAWGRILHDAFQSGFICGTPFQNAEGSWAVAWRLGGPPLIHFILPWVSLFVFFLGIDSTTVYIARKYHSYRRLKRLATYLVNPKNFRKTISTQVIVLEAVLILVGLIGATIDPKIIVPNAKPSPDYLGVDFHIQSSLSVVVTCPVIVNASPNILDSSNVTGWFYATIRPPDNVGWRVSDINASSIILNDKMRAVSTSIVTEQNNTSVLLVKFDKKSLLFVFEDQDVVKLGTAILKVSGSFFENGYFFQGSMSVKITQSLN